MTNQSHTLQAMFLNMSREELLYNAVMLGYKMDRKLKKATIARKLAEAMLASPQYWLKRLPFREVLRLQSMVHAKNHAVRFYESVVLSCNAQIGITGGVQLDGVIFEFISAELAEALNPVIDNYVRSAVPDTGIIRHEEIFMGLLNLYGFLSRSKMLELCRKADASFTEEVMKRLIDDSYYVSCNTRFVNHELAFTSPFVSDFEQLLADLDARKNIGYASFSLNQILAAADSQFPMPPESEFTGGFRNAVIKMHLKNGMEAGDAEAEVNRRISNIWMNLNNGAAPTDMIQELIDDFNLQFKDLQQFMNILMNLGNQFPQWLLKGQSPRSVFETHERPKLQQQPPQIVMGPNAVKAGVNISQEDVNKLWAQSVKKPDTKTGRNDPCPCGSGRKFKHCCLNTLN